MKLGVKINQLYVKTNLLFCPFIYLSNTIKIEENTVWLIKITIISNLKYFSNNK